MIRALFLYNLLVSSILLVSCTRDNVENASENVLSEDQRRLPEHALEQMTVMEGLEVELFASEPMVTNPTNISIDHKGRVWVCEAYNYDVAPEKADPKGDRILVLEDTDGNGKADKRTVFYQGEEVNTPLGIMVVGNQVYISRSPNVFLFTDTNGDLVADKKEVLFTNLGRKGDHSAHSVVPGPDGKLYFSTGNMSGEIKDKDGNAVKDRAGFVVTQKGNPYLGGMIMRFDEAGKSFEVLAHNFRNNYEPCVDSYGNIWQSDNDDDGNESCRINYIMPYGNYGYLDEKTKASWPSNRVGLEKEISQRHWHQNDPGVVPNVLITGAGSPAGMTINEGAMLPAELSGVPVHAEPYYNVVRAYLPSQVQAGYTATIKDILKSTDQWFRPVDVAIAPDGSLFVADWYDPILGGGAAGDADRGRIYRISDKKDKYNVPEISFSSGKELIAALKNPNAETRFMAHKVMAGGKHTYSALLKDLWNSENKLWRARSLWLLGIYDDDNSFIREALKDNDPAIRQTAIRFVLQHKDDVVPFLEPLIEDKDPHVQREVLTALRYNDSDEAADLWAKMAKKYTGEDRWFLEALGIASDLHADKFFTAWTNTTTVDFTNKAHQDIIWRIRSSMVLPMLAQIIEGTPDTAKVKRFFRAFDFHNTSKNDVLLRLATGPDPAKATLALQQVEASALRVTPVIQNVLRQSLQQTEGSIAFVNLVGKFGLKDRVPELIDIAIKYAGTDMSSAAIDQIIRFGTSDHLEAKLKENNASTVKLLKSLESKGDANLVKLVSSVASSKSNSLTVRQSAIHTLGTTWPGEEALLSLVKSKSLDEELKPAAAGVLFNVYRSSIQREATNYLPRPEAQGKKLPPIKELLASSGDKLKGKALFTRFCATCHRADNVGVKFGPELSDVGNKLSKEGLYRSIIYPDDGISHGFAGTLLRLKDGTKSMGIITSETDKEVELSFPGGTTNKYAKSEIQEMSASDKSIMPALAPAMTTQDLVDLVTFLSDLKNDTPQ